MKKQFAVSQKTQAALNLIIASNNMYDEIQECLCLLYGEERANDMMSFESMGDSWADLHSKIRDLVTDRVLTQLDDVENLDRDIIGI